MPKSGAWWAEPSVDRIILTRCERCGEYSQLEWDFIHMHELLYGYNDDNLYRRPSLGPPRPLPVGSWYGDRILTIEGGLTQQACHQGCHGRYIGLYQLEHILKAPFTTVEDLLARRVEAYERYARGRCPLAPASLIFEPWE